MKTEQKLRRLRSAMKSHGIDAYIVPSTDPHQSEYVAEHFRSRQWLSGFFGSSGTVVVTERVAGLWTDSRYYIEAEEALKDSEIALFKAGLPDIPDYPAWLAQTLEPGSTVSFDARLFSVGTVRELTSTLEHAGLTVAPGDDLIDQLWEDRPSLPTGQAFLIPESVAGEGIRQKLTRLRHAIREHGADHMLLTSLDDIAWLLNLRGSDIPYNPLALCYAVITPQGVQLCMDREKLAPVDKHQLRESGVEISSYDSVRGFIDSLPDGTALLVDPDRVSEASFRSLPPQVTVIEAKNPTELMKACKNDTELDGIRQAMVRDGVAMVRFFYWLETQIGSETITEASAGERLHAFRAEQPEFRGDSFHPIVAYKEHGAIAHYAATQASAKELEDNGTLLIDSGGHYSHGTTDVTRVVPLGPCSARFRRDYTLVLKGHIALATTRFPHGTSGHQLDTVARTGLWQHGLNYGHGTGHGVGFFLNVHEGPQRLSAAPNSVALLPGMIVSNEPGLYRKGEYGIRIENLVAVTEAHGSGEPEALHSTPESSPTDETFYELETLTICPIETAPVDVEMLSDEERRWLNAYHERVYKCIAPHVKPEIRAWLLRKTEQI